MSERDTPNEADAQLVGTQPGDAAAPMRLRAEPPRVTRLSRKVLGGISLVAALGGGEARVLSLERIQVGVFLLLLLLSARALASRHSSR